MRAITRLLLVAGLTLSAATPLAAQWDTPTFFAPRPGEDIGLYVMKPEFADWGFAAIWRQEGNLNLGVRAGLSDGDVINVGAEFYGPLNLMAESSLLLDWILGVGASFNGETNLHIPAGVSIGANLGSPGSIQLKPYAHPRVAFDLFAFNVGDEERTETEFNVDLDLGADAALGQAFVLRAGFTLRLTNEGRTTFGAGLAYKMPRRLAVR